MLKQRQCADFPCVNDVGDDCAHVLASLARDVVEYANASGLKPSEMDQWPAEHNVFKAKLAINAYGELPDQIINNLTDIPIALAAINALAQSLIDQR